MTTGRINQVTIVSGAPNERARRSHHPEGRRSSCTLREVRTPSTFRSRSEATRDFTRHPIAPTEFPTDRSAAHRHHPREGGHLVQHTTRRRRIPSTGHARERLPAWAYPQLSYRRSSHRPTIHRPQHRSTARCRLVSALPPSERLPGIASADPSNALYGERT